MLNILLKTQYSTMIPYVMTWDGIVTTYHTKYSKLLGITTSTEAYIQTRALKKTLESISFEYRRENEEGEYAISDIEVLAEKLTTSSCVFGDKTLVLN